MTFGNKIGLSFLVAVFSASICFAQRYPTLNELIGIREAMLNGKIPQVSQQLAGMGYNDHFSHENVTQYSGSNNLDISVTDDGDVVFKAGNASAEDKHFYEMQLAKRGTLLTREGNDAIFSLPKLGAIVTFNTNILEVFLTTSNSEYPGTPTELKITINQNTNTDLYLYKGERVKIKAQGRMTYGLFAGSGGPSGIMGFNGYNIVSRFPHGSLMAKVGDDGNWQLIGSEATITADRDGYLKLYINDNEPGNNSGSFAVTFQMQYD